MPESDPLVVFTTAVPGPIDVGHARVTTLTGVRDPVEMRKAIAGAHAIVTMYFTKVDGAFLDAAGPQLKGVSNFAVGYDNIDVRECERRGVKVTNTPHAVTEGTADLAWALVLAVARRLIEADRYARSPAYPAKGQLEITDFLGRDLTGRNLLIVGAGRIGYAVAQRSLGWGMRVSYVARQRHVDFELAPLAAKRVTLEDGLREADVVSVHTPLTPDTRHLINEKTIALMKPTAILINTARGPVIDEAALARALREKKIWGAGLDVFEYEPKVHPDLLGLDNCTLTPHIGSAEQRFRELMTEMVCENVRAILAGKEPPNRVRV